MESVFDIAVIGGGINGCGIAADASLRGLRVLLVEKDDFASHTSSASTKLIHGGLRYLENLHLSLVKKALTERQTLYKIAPHLVNPLPIVMPISLDIRSEWRIRAGLFLYDHLSLKNTFPKSRKVHREKEIAYFENLNPEYQKAFLFYDGTADDARLTISNALQAQQYGATLLRDTALVQATVEDGIWNLSLKTKEGELLSRKARVVINATGAFIQNVQDILGLPHRGMTFVKGSHIILPKLYQGKHAYLLQHEDKRIIFAIPFGDNFTMIGTTDVLISHLPENISVDQSEVNYLLQATQRYFKTTLNAQDIRYKFSGVRTLLPSEKDALPQNLSRDYQMDITQKDGIALTIYGGKITTYRRLAEEAIDKLSPFFPTLSSSLSGVTPLPGAVSFRDFCKEAPERYFWLPQKLLERFLKTYGTRTEMLIGGAKTIEQMGEYLGEGLYEQEVHYLKEKEWAKSVDDILWRRTKLGLYFSEEMKEKLVKML